MNSIKVKEWWSGLSRRTLVIGGAVVLLLLVSAIAVIASDYQIDLTEPGASDYYHDSWFFQIPDPESSAGTGNYDPFLQIKESSNPEPKGYNTDADPQFQEVDIQTHAVLMSDLPMVNYLGEFYREFYLDINQNSPAIFSLDEIKIYAIPWELPTGASGSMVTDYDPAAETFGGVAYPKLWDLDEAPPLFQDVSIYMDYTIGAGSGYEDVRILVAESFFDGYPQCNYGSQACTTWVTVWNQFGLEGENNDGFEEWGTVARPTVAGSKWHDEDADGVWDEGELGLAGWDIQAFADTDGDGLLSATEYAAGPVGTMTTDAYGGYAFAFDDPGDYIFCEVLQTDWLQSFPAPANDICAAGSPELGDGGWAAYAGYGDHLADYDFGNYNRGCLEVTKTVDWAGITPDDAQTFEVCITGPSFPSGDCQTVGYMGGTLSWSNLLPGDYTISETDPGVNWDVALPGTVPVYPGDTCSTAGVTNTFLPGSLKVTKTVDWIGAEPDVSKTFEICITGPTHLAPDGAGYLVDDCKTADYDGGELVWTGLVPGEYSISETDPGSEWIVEITGSPATVVANQEATATVDNTLKYGRLEITKVVVNWDDVPDPDQVFAICIVGPSYPSGDCQTVGYMGGTLIWENLIPGEYTFYEVDPGVAWRVSYNPDSQVIGVPPDQTGYGTVSNTQLYLGYTPGFWKNHGPDAPSGNDAWKYTNWNYTDEFCSIFAEVCIIYPDFEDLLLWEALYLQGGTGYDGAAEILARHAVATYLNADLNEVQTGIDGFGSYPYSTAQVVYEVTQAFASGERETMLLLAAQFDLVNNEASDYFDWTGWTLIEP